MTIADDAQRRIDAYLKQLRKGLRGIGDDDARDIVEELRSHILDKASVGGDINVARVEAALAALGTPEELARQYVTDDLLARAEASRSPLLILNSLLRWAGLSVAGAFVLLGTFIGYFLAVVFALVALLKPLHPHTAGLWMLSGNEYSIRLGFAGAPAGAREVLGWWIVPIGLFLGYGLFLLTTRFALWSVRQYRRSRELPHG
jgi:HAAS